MASTKGRPAWFSLIPVNSRASASTDPASPLPTLLATLREIVGRRNVLTGERRTRRFLRGFRVGGGPALAVVRPGSLVELWRIANACVRHHAIVIMQAANTGLTGGSTPWSEGYDRPVVVINTTRLAAIHPLRGGHQVVCLPGATLHGLESLLAPLGREPHSVIGSSCIGASVIGGVCNNSGGALIRRGPAFTEMALYAQLCADGNLQLVDSLGLRLGTDPETILARLDAGAFDEHDIIADLSGRASDEEYVTHVRNIEASTPARFNADPRCLHGASGSAGRVIVFAVRLDTFPLEQGSATYYVGTNDPGELARIRRDILVGFEHLPIAGEYIHRTAFDIAERYGKDTFLAIQHLGTSRLTALFRWKARIDGLAPLVRLFGEGLSDRLLQRLGGLFPDHLPARMRQWRDRFEHHLLLKMPASALPETRAYLNARYPNRDADFFECTPEEGRKAFLHRSIHRRGSAGIVALDFALPRNATDWVETLPAEIERAVKHKLYYGHFFCHVFHHDYVVAPGHDPHELEQAMLPLLDARGAEYPAEHNVGHLYAAKPALAAFYRALDPCNQFNPGIGMTSRHADWKVDGGYSGEGERT
jgi:D-lactate dehydrogenase